MRKKKRHKHFVKDLNMMCRKINFSPLIFWSWPSNLLTALSNCQLSIEKGNQQVFYEGEDKVRYNIISLFPQKTWKIRPQKIPKDEDKWYLMSLFLDIQKNFNRKSDTYIMKMHEDHLAKYLRLAGINWSHIEIHFFILCSYIFWQRRIAAK